MYGQLLEAIIDHMNLSNREDLIQALRKSQEPTPEQQQQQQQQQALQKGQLEAQINAFNGQAQESAARAQKIQSDIALGQYEAETDRIKALSSNLQPGDEDDKEFQRRAKIAELYLKEQEINNKASQQSEVTNANEQRMGTPLPSSGQQAVLGQQETGANAEANRGAFQAQAFRNPNQQES